ncbi:MAG: HEAT repeat domain-containing protein [Fimbriimonadaceae bacterium]|nr:HEAT repeat domain-containing protein [Fimbriimonadaceae bacterium]
MAREDFPQEGLLSNILVGLGILDSAPSHRFLCRLLSESEHPFVRAEVLEALSFEHEHGDFRIALPYLAPEADVQETLSALYMLEFLGYAGRRPKAAREHISPLLSHENPNVRSFAVSALAQNRSNRALILSLENDPYLSVRAAVLEAIWKMDR